MKDETFNTKDFYIGCCLLAAGFNLLKLEPGNGKFVTFVFSDPKGNAEKTIADHWQRNLVLPTKDVISAIVELKTRIYSNHAE